MHRIKRGEVDNVCGSAACRSLKMLLTITEKQLFERIYIPVLITHCWSSLALMHWLASSYSKSCRSSIRWAYSSSVFRLRLRLRASHSGRGRAVDEPDIVYTGISEWLLIFIACAQSCAEARRKVLMAPLARTHHSQNWRWCSAE